MVEIARHRRDGIVAFHLADFYGRQAKDLECLRDTMEERRLDFQVTVATVIRIHRK